jgi:cytochrome b6-f complex iron-sulfur subunit
MMAAASADEFVPDMQRRTIMNLVLLGGAAVPVGWMGGGFIYFFVPPTGGGGGGALTALDANGDAVKASAWTKARQPGDRSLVQGLKGDAHYLITTENGLQDYALNAVCTHLGCVVPWNRAANKFMCPCHGS